MNLDRTLCILLFQKADCCGLFAPKVTEKVERPPAVPYPLELVFHTQVALFYSTELLSRTVNSGFAFVSL